MGLLVDGLLFITAAGVLIASAVYSASAATNITKIDSWKKDEDLKSAHSWLSWSTALGWISVVLIIVLIVLYVMFGSETAEATGGLAAKGFLFLTLGAMLITGIFSALGAAKIGKSQGILFAKDNGAYSDAIWATVLAIVGAVFIGGLFFWKITHKNAKPGQTKEQKEFEKKKEELKKELIEEKEAQLKEKKAEALAAAAEANRST